jgi:SAM-dependent methyltransferase
VTAIDPKPGQRVLELAAGPGETGFLVAQRLGPDGTLLSTDQSPDMVEVARRRAAELGLTNVEFQVLDGQQIDLDERSFDAVLCRWGYMLMVHPVVVGAGKRLFGELSDKKPLRLVDTRTVGDGVVVQAYEPVRDRGQDERHGPEMMGAEAE